MQDIDALCQRVLLIGKGRLLLDGAPREIRAMAGENLSTEESVAGPVPPVRDLRGRRYEAISVLFQDAPVAGLQYRPPPWRV